MKYLTWIAAFLTWVLGDTVTTLLLVSRPGFREGNPFVAWVLDLGPLYFICLKVALFAVCYALVELVPDRMMRFGSLPPSTTRAFMGGILVVAGLIATWSNTMKALQL